MNEDNKIISYFQRNAVKVRLSDGEKVNIKNHIIFSPYLFHSTFFTYKRLVGVVAVLALLISSGGTSFAAASSLPGDALYGVKININEEVQSFIALSPDARSKVDANRVNERLNEAEQLSAQGKLTTQNQAIIKENLKRHTSSLRQNVAILASENKTDEANAVIDNLTQSLDQHQAALQDISSSTISSKNNNNEGITSAATSTEEITNPTPSDGIAGIISAVVETKAEVNIIKDSINDTNNASSTASTNIDGSLDAQDPTLNASTTIDIDASVNAPTTASTTIKADLDITASTTLKAKLLKTFVGR